MDLEGISELLVGVAIGALGVVPFLHANLLVEIAAGLGGAALFTSIAFSRLAFEPFGAFLTGVAGPTQNISIAAARQLLPRIDVWQLVLKSIFFAALIAFALLPVAAATLPFAYNATKAYTPLLLSAIVALSFLNLQGLRSAVAALFVYALASLVGFFALRLASTEPMFPLLTGLYGLPLLLYTLRSSNALAAQTKKSAIARANIAKGAAIKLHVVAAGVALGWLSVLLPALTPALVAALLFLFLEQKPVHFLCLSSATIGSRAVFELVALETIGKARSGYAAAIQSVGGNLATNALAALIALGIATLLALLLRSYVARAYKALNNELGAALLIAAIFAAVLALSGTEGILIAVVATCAGVVPLALKLPRTYLVGALATPTILWYIGW